MSITVSAGGWLTALLLAAVALLPIWPNLLDPVLPATHEHVRYAVLSGHFVDALAAGQWYPRWLPELNAGYGYPQFVFYQPGYFFLNGLLALLTDDLLWRQLLTLCLLCLCGGVGVYRLARGFVGPVAALALVVLFQSAPYVQINLFERGDLSEWMVTQLSPWVLYGVWALLHPSADQAPRQRAQHWCLLTLALTACFYSHPIAVLWLPPMVGLLALPSLCDARHATAARQLRTGLELGAALLLALALSSPYWLTVAQLKPLVNVQVAVAGGWQPGHNTASVLGLLFGSLRHAGSFNESEFLAAPFVLLAVFGLWSGRRNRLILAAGLVYLLLLLAMLPSGRWFWQLYPFSLLQFPWRLATFAPLLQVACVLGLWQAPPAHQRSALALGLLAVGWSAWHHYGFQPLDRLGLALTGTELACIKNYPGNARPGTALATLDVGEWLPLAFAHQLPSRARNVQFSPACQSQLSQHRVALQQMLGTQPFSEPAALDWMSSPTPGWQGQRAAGHSPHHLHYHFAGPGPGTVVIEQVYLPGWSVQVDQQLLTAAELERQLLPDARMQVMLSPGAHSVRASYDGPPHWRARNLALLLALALALLYWLRQNRSDRRGNR